MVFKPTVTDLAAGTKKCPACSTVKSIAEFGTNKGRGGGGVRSLCKPCAASYARAKKQALSPEKRAAYAETDRRWREAHPRPHDPVASRRRMLLFNYGLTPEQFEAMLAAQGGCCAICRRVLDVDRPRTIHIDHCHDTAGIRGVLCLPCNHALGTFGDNLAGVMRVVEYLSRPALYPGRRLVKSKAKR